MSAHTPGPWMVSERDPQRVHAPSAANVQVAFAGDNFSLMREATHVMTEGEAEANARLIAEAPDMLALLQRLDRDWFTPLYGDSDTGSLAVELRNAIRAALAKASGVPVEQGR